MAVAVDATTAATTDPGTVATLTISNLTVGAALSNGALAAAICWANNAVPGTITAKWDNAGTPQTMTLIASTTVSEANSDTTLQLYGLLAPTAGNKQLVISWTGGSFEAHAAAISFSGVDQTSVAVAFPHGNTATGDTATATVAITSATGNMVVSAFGQNSSTWGTISGTTIASESSGPSAAFAASYNSGAATVTQTAVLSSGTNFWSASGCDVLAAAGGGDTLGGAMPILMMSRQRDQKKVWVPGRRIIKPRRALPRAA